MKDESLKEELDRISPRLSDMKSRGDGFQVPEYYFDTFESRLMDRIATHHIQRPAPQPLVKRPARRVQLYQWIVAAAAVAALVFAALWFFKPTAPTTPDYASVQLTDEDIESYLLDNAQEFEVTQLASLQEDERTPAAMPQPSPGPDKSIRQTTTDSLNDISPEDLNHVINDMTEDELEAIL